MTRVTSRSKSIASYGKSGWGPIRPSADEAREITENHAALLIDLLAEQREAQRRDLEADRARLSMDIQVEFQKYAGDFGVPAAKQLLAHCRRQAGVNWRNTCER